MTASTDGRTLAARYHLNDNEEWKSLLTHLEFADGMALIILLVPDSYGTRVCKEKLKRYFAARRKKLHVVRIGLRDSAEGLVESIENARQKNVGAFWIETEKSESHVETLLGLEPFDMGEREAFARSLRALNPERNQLRRNISAPLIFVGPVWLQTVFRESAPDLWSIRSTVINIQLSAHDLVDASTGLRMPHEKHFAPPDKDTEVRAQQLRDDIKVLEDKPGRELLRAELLRRLGVELTNLLRWDEAEQVLTEAYQLHQDHHAPQPDLASVARDLGRLLRKKGAFDRAKYYFEIALDAEKSAFGLNHGRYCRALTDLGSILQDLGEYDAAERLLREALNLSEKRDPIDRAVSVDLSNLALLLTQTGRHKEAEPLFRRALEILTQLQPPDPTSEATVMDNLATTVRRLGKLEEAEQLARRALSLTEGSLGPDHPDTAVRLANFASLLDHLGRWSEAEVAARRALDLDEKCYGKNHHLVATNLITLASGLSRHDQAALAEPFARRALSIFANWNSQNKRPHPVFDQARQLYSSVLAKIGVPKSRISQRLSDVIEGKKMRQLKRAVSRKRGRRNIASKATH